MRQPKIRGLIYMKKIKPELAAFMQLPIEALPLETQ